ncbi:hypothetical protein CDD83_7580 [Cordyceps sp. RAO-2017]|nr:hypothetical protein CDD83_7580 [Cordyceps sp. RAO-2017]
MPPDFHKQSYWRNRFTTETAFEWLMPSDEFMSVLRPQLDALDASSARILHVGSGTSDLHIRLRRRGFVDVTNLDYEPLAAQRGRQLEELAFGDARTRYVVADVTQLAHAPDLGHDVFDLIIDKSAADAVSCGGEAPLLHMVCGIRDRLAPDGVWISLSYSTTRFDVPSLPFDIDIMAKHPAPKLRATDADLFYWCYRMRRK